MRSQRQISSRGSSCYRRRADPSCQFLPSCHHRQRNSKLGRAPERTSVPCPSKFSSTPPKIAGLTLLNLRQRNEGGKRCGVDASAPNATTCKTKLFRPGNRPEQAAVSGRIIVHAFLIQEQIFLTVMPAGCCDVWIDRYSVAATSCIMHLNVFPSRRRRQAK